MRRVNGVALPINDFSARRAGWTKSLAVRGRNPGMLCTVLYPVFPPYLKIIDI
jgi:hypothetical protein